MIFILLTVKKQKKQNVRHNIVTSVGLGLFVFTALECRLYCTFSGKCVLHFGHVFNSKGANIIII